MQTLSLGDLSQSLILNRHSAQLKTALQNLTTETTTGMAADQTARLHGNFAQIAGIETSLTLLDAYRNVAAETQIRASTLQQSVTTVQSQSALGPAFLTISAGQVPVKVDTLGLQAAQSLDTAMMALNASVGGRALFSGQQTASPALASSDFLLSALSTAITAAGATTAAGVESAVTAWFDAPAGFAAVIYQGGPPLDPVQVSADQTVRLDVTANDPAIRDTLKGLALGALLSRGILAGNDAARADLANRAGQHLVAAQVPMTTLAAKLGAVQTAVQDAATRNDAEDGVLQSARLSLLSVDPYETATKYQQTQDQLQTLYAITARASRLSLVDYL
jgi:flagellar hook-associated protein 3 FlgL